ncbi:hypothetical protein MFIFM68171_04565 [Madurella fahalii]|uniref:Small acidic protein n=1 Tax=Madurella fahalii TaxID=1157608 RepID=A0ABQ0G9U2_9PEZI
MGDKSKKVKDRKEAAAEVSAVSDDTHIKGKGKKTKMSKAESPDLETQAPGVSEVHNAPTKAADNGPKKEKKDRKRKRESVDVPVESETSAENESRKLNTEGDAEPVKKKSKKDRKSNSDKTERKTKDRKDKRDIKQDESDNDQDAVVSAKGKKENKREKKAKHQQGFLDTPPTRDDEIMEATAAADKGEKKERKKKRKHKHKDQPEDVEMVDVNTAASEPEETKAEKGKEDLGQKRKKEKEKRETYKKFKDSAVSEEALKEKAPTSASAPAAEADLSERWNVHGLGGGAKRQDKFMRLLGGKKHGATAPAEAKEGSRQRFDIARVEQQLEQQYDAGIRMKFEGGGQRRGLGA